jgi:hypothetical protein
MRKNILLSVLLFIIWLGVTVCDKTPTAPDHSNPLDPKHGPPKILSVAPLPAAKDLPVDTAIVVRFDDVMNNATITEATFKVQHTLDNQTLAIKGKLTFGQNASTIANFARFTPEGFYLYNNAIAVSLVAANIKDNEGLSLTAENNNWGFATYPLTQVSQLKLFVGSQLFRHNEAFVTSANTTANLKLYGYKNATDSLDITSTVKWKPTAPAHLSVQPGKTALLTISTTFDSSRITATIYNKNQSGKLDSISFALPIDTRGPAAPALKTPDDGKFLNSKRPVFEWNGAAGAARYLIVVDDDANFSSPQVIPETEVTALNFTTSFDLADKGYYWRVLAVNNLNNRGPWSNVRRFTIDTVKPDKIMLNSPADMFPTNDTTPEFKWFAVSGAQFYEFELDNTSDFTPPVVESKTDLTVLSYNTSAQPQGIYFWHVRAKDAAGNLGDWSDSRQIQIDTEPPFSPVLRTPDDNTETNDTTPEFDWEDAAGAKFYEIQVDNNANFSSPEAADTTLQTSVYVVPNALSDGAYKWRVRSRDAAGNKSAWAGPRTVTIRTTRPNPPQQQTPENGKAINDNTPKFDWSTVSGTTYDLQVDNNSDLQSPEINLRDLTNSEHQVLNSLPDGTYYWRVRARDAAQNESDWSTIWSVIIDIVPPSAPDLISPINTEINTNMPTFVWTTVAGATTYNLQVTKTLLAPNNPDFNTLEINQTGLTTSSFTAQSPLADAIYYWRVRAKDAADNISAWANFRSFTLYVPPPDKPTNPVPSNGSTITNNTPKLEWNDVIGAAFYELQVTDSLGPNNGAIFANLDIDQQNLIQSEFQVATALLNGVHGWRVRGRDSNGIVRDWADIDVWVVTIDAPFPANPYLITPNNGQTNVLREPAFDWSDVVGANMYELQVTDSLTNGNPDFSIPDLIKTTLTQSQYQVPTVEALASGKTYYWRARAKQNGNPGPWSSIRKFTVQ